MQPDPRLLALGLLLLAAASCAVAQKCRRAPGLGAAAAAAAAAARRRGRCFLLRRHSLLCHCLCAGWGLRPATLHVVSADEAELAAGADLAPTLLTDRPPLCRPALALPLAFNRPAV